MGRYNIFLPKQYRIYNFDRRLDILSSSKVKVENSDA
jgi:hypothetical protein